MRDSLRFRLVLLALLLAAACSGTSADSQRLTKFEDAITSGASCDDLFTLGNDITTGSRELSKANTLFSETGCVNSGASFLAEQTVTFLETTTSTSQVVAVQSLGDDIQTSSSEAPTTTTTTTTAATTTTDRDMAQQAVTVTTLVADGTDPGFAVGVEAVLDANHIRISGGWPVELIGLADPNACSEDSAISMLTEMLPVGTQIGIVYGALEYDDDGNAMLYVTRLDDGVEVNATMIANGAVAHDPSPMNTLFQGKFAALEAQAADLGLGNWSACALE